MKVVELKSRLLFGTFYPDITRRVPEGLKFLAKAGLVFVAPALAYCYVTSQSEFMYLTAGQLAIGTLLGASLHNRPPAGPASCVPRLGDRKEPAAEKKAA